MNLVEQTERCQQRHWVIPLWKKFIMYFIHCS